MGDKTKVSSYYDKGITEVTRALLLICKVVPTCLLIFHKLGNISITAAGITILDTFHGRGERSGSGIS